MKAKAKAKAKAVTKVTILRYEEAEMMQEALKEFCSSYGPGLAEAAHTLKALEAISAAVEVASRDPAETGVELAVTAVKLC